MKSLARQVLPTATAKIDGMTGAAAGVAWAICAVFLFGLVIPAAFIELGLLQLLWGVALTQGAGRPWA